MSEADEGEIVSYFVGLAVKVLHVSADGDELQVLQRDGKQARVTLPRPSDLEVGDLLLLGDRGWEHLPPEAWSEEAAIAIVREVLDDQLLIEDNSGIRLVAREGAAVQKGNTVEYADGVGVVRVLAERPIRSHDRSDGEVGPDRFALLPSESRVTFEQFGGYPDVVARARELIETQLEKAAHLTEIGARPIKGILFTGPPGTGKTMLAKIIAHESDAKFFVVSGPEIVSKWVGDSESLLRDLFDAAEREERAIIFFDEIDSVAERRQSDTHDSSKRLVAQFLTEMDGFDERSGSNVVVIAATNRVDDIDRALLRPGRFDWQIEFGMPTLEDRLAILSVSSQSLSINGSLPLEIAAARSAGWSAAKLTSIWTEAALLAAKGDRRSISEFDFAEAFERVASRPSADGVSNA